MSVFTRLSRRWDDPDRIAVSTGDVAWTYGDLLSRSARASGLLASLGARSGDVVALMLPRTPAFLELFLGALRAGVAVVPMNDRYTDREASYLLGDARPRVAILPDGACPAVPAGCVVLRAQDVGAALAAASPVDATDVDDETVAVIGYTSGTTGRPKGALIPHRALIAQLTALHDAWRWTRDDRLLHALPLFHIHGLFIAQLGALWANARTDWVERFDALDTLHAIERLHTTVFMGVPTFYQRFLELPEPVAVDLSRVRLFTCGSAPLPGHVLDAFAARFGHRVLERYGMTEVGIVLSNPYDGPRVAGSVGLPLPGVQAAVADTATDEPVPDGEVGELRIGGPTRFLGYHGDPEKTAASLDAHGRMRTGDLAVRDADGTFRIVGRLRDLVIVGGLNVYPSEIEAVLADHPDVADVACVGVIDADLGERVVADVIGKAGADVSIPVLAAWARGRLSPYKCPRAWRVVSAFPRNAMGKVEKARIRAAWEVPCVRHAVESDVADIAKGNLALALESENVRLPLETAYEGVRAVFDRNVGARYFVAEVAGQYAGQCMITTEWSDWRARHVWWLQSAYVRPAFRQRGVFRALFDAVTSAGKTQGAAGIRLYVDKTNTRASSVYRALAMDGEHYAMFELMFVPDDRGTP